MKKQEQIDFTVRQPSSKGYSFKIGKVEIHSSLTPTLWILQGHSGKEGETKPQVNGDLTKGLQSTFFKGMY